MPVSLSYSGAVFPVMPDGVRGLDNGMSWGGSKRRRENNISVIIGNGIREEKETTTGFLLQSWGCDWWD